MKSAICIAINMIAFYSNRRQNTNSDAEINDKQV